jgi:hypothetical protein
MMSILFAQQFICWANKSMQMEDKNKMEREL